MLRMSQADPFKAWSLEGVSLQCSCTQHSPSCWRDPLEYTETIPGISNKCKSSNFLQINSIQTLLQPSIYLGITDFLTRMLMEATKI